jgi:drug/metabolite transporter (DMT)-like permease
VHAGSEIGRNGVPNSSSSGVTPPSVLQTASLTVITLCAFAANSVLARMALGTEAADPAGFTTVRLVSGAAALWLIVRVRGRGAQPRRSGSWTSGWWLFLYAIAFSFAYVSLPTGTGALILFAAVQVTMILSGIVHGEPPTPLQWFGLAVAMTGLVVLVAPGATAPSPVGSLLMAVAGASWGLYSVRGRGISDPVAATAENFARSAPMVLAVAVAVLPTISVTPAGLILGVLSGAVASGLGYVGWYAAMRGLTTTQASVVQLSVPVLAAAAGVILLSEDLTGRLLMSGAAILGGVAVAVATGEKGA